MIGPWTETTGPVFLPDPVNRAHPLNQGRLAWWLALPGLDGGRTWYDLLGRAPGTLNGFGAGYGWVGSPYGAPAASLSLDGASAYVACGDALHNLLGTSYTVAAWVRPAQVSSSQIFSAYRSTTSYAFFWQLDQNGPDARLLVRDDALNIAVATYTGALAVGGVYRVVGVRSGNDLSVYVNGMPGTGASGTFGAFTTPNALLHGALNDASTTPTGFFSGTLRDVAAWSRALSAAEVGADYELSLRGYPGVLNRLAPSLFPPTLAVSAPAAATIGITLGGAALAGAAATSAPATFASVLGTATLTAAGSAAAAPAAGPVTIAPLVGTANSAATGRGHQSHLVYGANSGRWWLAYQSAAATITFLRSADFATWSAGGTYGLTLAGNPIDGRKFALAYLNKAATDVIHVCSTQATAATGATGSGYHGRVTAGAAGIATTNADAVLQSTASNIGTDRPFGTGVCLDANGIPVDFAAINHAASAGTYGNQTVTRATNADAGTAWTAGFPVPVTIDSAAWSIFSAAVVPLGAGTPAPVLMAFDNNPTSPGGTYTNLLWITYTNQTTTASISANILAAAVTAQDANDWGIARVSATNVHVVARAGANSFVHRRFNGAAWSAGATIPGMTTGHKAGSGLFLAQDGANVWLGAIDSGAANKVQAIKWTAAAAAWDAAWSDVATSTATRNFISGYPAVVGGNLGLVWTQANGTNFDVVGVLYPVAAAAAAAAGTFSVTLGGATLAGSALALSPATFAAAAGPAALAVGAAFAAAAAFGATTGGATLAAAALSGVSSAAFAAAPAGAGLAAGITVAAPAAFAATLGGATLAAAGTSAAPATFATTLGGVTLVAGATVRVSATFGVSLGGVALVTTAVSSMPAAFAATTGGAALAAVAAARMPAAFAATLAGAGLTGRAASASPAAFAAPTAGASFAALAAYTAPAAFAAAPAGAGLAGAATVSTAAAFAAPLGGATLAGSVAFAAPAPAAFAATLAGASLAAVAAYVAAGSGAGFLATTGGATLAAPALFRTPAAFGAGVAGVVLAAAGTLASPARFGAAVGPAILSAAGAASVPVSPATFTATADGAALAAAATVAVAMGVDAVAGPVSLVATGAAAVAAAATSFTAGLDDVALTATGATAVGAAAATIAYLLDGAGLAATGGSFATGPFVLPTVIGSRVIGSPIIRSTWES